MRPLDLERVKSILFNEMCDRYSHKGWMPQIKYIESGIRIMLFENPFFEIIQHQYSDVFHVNIKSTWDVSVDEKYTIYTDSDGKVCIRNDNTGNDDLSKTYMSAYWSSISILQNIGN